MISQVKTVMGARSSAVKYATAARREYLRWRVRRDDEEEEEKEEEEEWAGRRSSHNR